MNKLIFAISLIVVSCSVKIPAKGKQPTQLDKIKLPDGFVIEIFADDVNGARSLARTENGLIIVGSRGAGKIYAIEDKNNDFRADSIYVVAENLNSPNGVAISDGDLYIAEISKISKIENIEKNYKSKPSLVAVYDKLPTDGHHGWKYIAFGPDGKLYIPVGAPCNICESDSIYSAIHRLDLETKELEIFAKGIRNTVGFDWHPETKELWFTENGRDWMNDTMPPDELNSAPKKGMHFGFPYCHAGIYPDNQFGEKRSCDEFVKPEINLGPHVAALGMKFYEGEMFPEEYKNKILIAEHGSWNRKDPLGYRITMVEIKDNNAISYRIFAEGWLQDDDAWGRPVDILELPDGSILVSDDFGDKIYRISYQKK